MKNLQRFKKQQPTSQRTPGGSFKSNLLGDLLVKGYWRLPQIHADKEEKIPWKSCLREPLAITTENLSKIAKDWEGAISPHFLTMMKKLPL